MKKVSEARNETALSHIYQKNISDESNLSINTENEPKEEKLETTEDETSHFVSNSKRNSLEMNSYSLSEEEFFDCLG